MTKKLMTEKQNVVLRAETVIKKTAALPTNPNPDFVWPEFSTEQRRITHNSTLYKQMSIPEAFQSAYGMKLNIPKTQNTECLNLQPGDTIPLYIQEVNKKGVIFQQDNIKETIVCNSNLYQYPRFKNFIPTTPIRCKVISKDHNKIVVDPFAGMFDQWIQDHTTNLKYQYNMSIDKSIKVQDLHLVGGGFKGRVRVDTISDFCGKDMFIEAFIPGSQIVLNIEKNFERWEGSTVNAFIITYEPKPYSKNGDIDMILTCSTKEYLKHCGNKTIISWFNEYCLDSEVWKVLKNKVFKGSITGICHSSNKCGAFVELTDINITSMIPCSPEELSKFKCGETVEVKISEFEEPRKWNGIQMEHVAPYIIEDNCLKTCNIRLVLKLA